MRCLPFPLLFCLVSAGIFNSSGLIPKHRKNPKLRNLISLMKKQATMIGSLKDDLSAFKKQVRDELSTHRNQVASFTALVGFVGGQLHTIQQSVDAQLQAIQPKINAVSKSVAFTARLSLSQDADNNGIALQKHQIIVFGKVITNIGGAYNSSSGFFTAPVSGAYAFSLHLMAARQYGSIYLVIVKNGEVLDQVYAAGKSAMHDQGSTQVSTHLAAGDRVWVRHNKGSRVRGGWWTVFTGYLLNADY